MFKRSYKIVIGSTGSVAAVTVPTLLKSLSNISLEKNSVSFELHLIVTQFAKHFFKKEDLPHEVKLYDDDFEWFSWRRKKGVWNADQVYMADLMVLAPLTANTMSKIANGMCDNILSKTVRTWDFKKPVIFCPAMNVKMWEHPITLQNVETLKQWGFIEVPPISKTLACSSVGIGAMAHLDDIIKIIMKVVDS